MGDHPLDVLDSPVRRRIVDLLSRDEVEGGMTAAELGEVLGLHTTTARFHLDQLETAALVESTFQRRGVGRPRKVYRIPQQPVPTGSAEAPMAELTALLAEAWASAPGAAPPSPEEAGRQWALRRATDGAAGTDGSSVPRARTAGQWLGKVGATLDLLQRWGYTPELRTARGGRTAELTLLDCPLLELAGTHPAVVCGIHRGLLRGALEAVGEPDTEVGLQPLVGPGRCLATVTTRTPFAPLATVTEPRAAHPEEPSVT